MRHVYLLFALFASLAFAQGNTGQSTTGISRGNGLRIPAYETPGTGEQDYFADATNGNDSFDCRSTATPCLTLQGAMNHIPKLLRDLVKVTVANGNYACFRISGFTYDNGQQNNNAGLYITGNLINATVATGTATGISTAGSVGSNATFGTLTDSGQTWTVNDLRGKLVTIGASKFVISSNTATAITTVGTCSTCAGSVAYTIQVPGWNVNTACASPPTPLATAGANSCQICASNNLVNGRSLAGTITIENVGFTAAAGSMLSIMDNSSYRVNQWMKTGGTGNGVQPVQNGMNPAVFLTTGSITGDTSISAVNVTAGGYYRLTNVFAYGTVGALVAFAGSAAGGYPSATILSSEANNATTAGAILGTGKFDIQTSRFDCAGSGGFGLSIGVNSNAALTTLFEPTATLSLINSNVGSTCGTGILVWGGPVWALVNTTTITGATTGVMSNWGGEFIDLTTGGGNTITGGTNGFSLDNGAVTGAQSDVTTGSCITTPTYGSRYCK